MDPTGSEIARSRRAAWLVGALGLIELATLGPVLALCLMVIWPRESFRQQAEARLPPEQWAWAQATAPLAAGLAAVLGVGPGLALVSLAPAVRRRHKPAALTVRVLLLAQIVELLWLGVQRFPAAAESLRDGRPVHLTIYVLLVGTPLALLGYTFWRLGGAADRGGEV